MPINYADRQAKLRAITGVDAIAIVPGANMIYFTGLPFGLSKRPTIALFTAQGMSIIIPQMDMQHLDVRPHLGARPFMWTDAEGYRGAFRQAVDELGLRGKTLGVDGMTMRVTEWLGFAEADPTLRVKPVERDLIAIRAIKTPEEVDLMRQAIRISEAALASLMTWVQPGMTERAIARRLTDEMAQRGGDSLAFNTTVQVGANSAFPHGETGEHVLGADDILLIDFGAAVGGYPADITRVFCLGTPSAELQKLYDTVLAANTAAKEAAKPGVAMGAVDKAARDVITAAGYGEHFIHRTGHGLGLDIHEPIPQIAAGNEDVLQAGMVFTIEPGIYVPGLGGIRIEDNVLVVDGGIEVLTTYPRQFRVTP